MRALRPWNGLGGRPPLIGVAAMALALASCSHGTSGGDGDLAAIGVAITLAPGETVTSVQYVMTGPGGFHRNGTIAVGNSTTLSAVIGGIPAGAGYSITLTATTTDGTTTCSGSATFDVVAHRTTAVSVHLTCHGDSRTGSVLVNGTLNICPTIGGITATPAEVIVGNTIALAASASDPDNGPSPLSYHWTVSSGSLDDPSAASPTFTCLYPGTVTITAAVSDGDPAPDCADSTSVQVNCTAAGPQVYSWVVLGGGGQASARVITPDATCPNIIIDGKSYPMNVRVAAGTEPLRPTASAPADSKPSAFPVTTCEYPIPAGAAQVIAVGRSLPVPKAIPNRIVVLGDSGCRLKIGSPWQACSDTTAWPLGTIAASAAALHPDLVLHVGDYHYRENQCPADIAGCAGSPWGYGFDAWEADLFVPAAPLLAAAPWIMVRGNHELCTRAGQGWFRFLDSRPYDESSSCNDPTKDGIGNFSAPYAVPLGPGNQVVVFDSANTTNSALVPTSPTFITYQTQLNAVASLAADSSVFSIFANHHPTLAYTALPGATPIGGNAGLLSVMSATYPGAYLPPNIKMVLEGHNHVFEAIDFSTPHPVTFLSGNGGDNLDVNLPDPFPLNIQPAPGVTADAVTHMSSFGFMVIDRAATGWTVTEYKADGTLMATCAVDGSTDKVACDHTGFLHSR
jgi:hypothetical protein